MLNYIWLGLIVIAILVGVGYDIRDEVVNTYQNGQELTAEIAVMSLAGSAASAVSPDGVLPPGKYQGMLKISGRRFSEFYRLKSADTSLFLQPVALSISGKRGQSLEPEHVDHYPQRRDAAVLARHGAGGRDQDHAHRTLEIVSHWPGGHVARLLYPFARLIC